MAANDPIKSVGVIRGVMADGSEKNILVGSDGSLLVETSTTGRPSTGTTTSVASSATPVTILAANAGRFGASVYNESTAILYLLLGAGTASATVYTVQLTSGQFYEVPYGFTGILTGLWATANGNARVTEFTA